MRTICVLFCFALVLARASGLSASSIQGVFVGLPLQLDTQLESPAVNQNVLSLPPQNPGDVFHLQLFVPAAAGSRSFGYNVEFDLIGKPYAEYLTLPTGETWDGTKLRPTEWPAVSALLLSTPSIPGNGYLGTVEISVRKGLEEGAILVVKSASMADPSADSDPLDVSTAGIVFTTAVDPIPGDIDLDGNVSFSDFLILAGNYGKTGPKPSGGGQVITRTVVVHDTITVLHTVRDTIYVQADTPLTDTPVSRAEKLLGFWRFDYDLLGQWTDQYHLQRLTGEKTDDGELFVEGESRYGHEVFASYAGDGNYILVELVTSINTGIHFQIIGDRAVGSVLLWFSDESISNAREYRLIPPSGRTSGFVSLKPSGTREKAEEMRQLGPGAPKIPEALIPKIQRLMDSRLRDR